MIRYILDHTPDLQVLIQKICDHLSLSPQPPLHLKRQFMDSVDWRLYNAGIVLEAETGTHLRQLRWQPLDPAQPTLIFPHPRGELGFVWDLPDGPLKDHLAPVLDMRCLMAQLTLQSHRHSLIQCDENGKTLLTIHVETHHVEVKDHPKSLNLEPTLTVEAVRGYDKAYEGAITSLEKMPELTRAQTSLFQDGLALIGRTAGDYSSKIKLTLDPDLPAAQTTHSILTTLFDTMVFNEAGTIADLDSEYLHDFRVAVRRTRSALSQIKDVLPQAPVDHYKQEFAWLGQITGPTRDMDVYLLGFEKYRSLLPDQLKPALDPLKTFLIRHQRAEQRKLARQLRAKRYQDLKDSYSRFLSTPNQNDNHPAKAKTRTKKVADKRIWKVYSRLVDEGRAITPDSPATALHELRKTAKKLRYLIEFFQSLYPSATIKALIKSLKLLQENLGDFQDLEVQTHALQNFANQMQQEKIGNVDTFLAMGALCLHLTENQQKARLEFAQRFAIFDAKQNQAIFEQLFRSAHKSDRKLKD